MDGYIVLRSSAHIFIKTWFHFQTKCVLVTTVWQILKLRMEQLSPDKRVAAIVLKE